MKKKKAAKKKVRRKPKQQETTRPVFGFWYNQDEKGPVHIILKDARIDHLVVDEFWGNEDY